jgi:hypothetical protein
MRQRIFGAVALLCLLAVGPAFAHDLDGKWAFAVTLDAGSGTANIELKVEGNAVTGKYTGQIGEADVTGTVDGDKVEISFEGQAGKVTYTGTLADGKITGTCQYGELGSGTFEATKSESA